MVSPRKLVVCFGLGVFLFSGCQLAQWRVFQKTVPDNTAKPPAQIEGEKQAASYIKVVTTPPVADPAKTVQDVHEVATGLSASLGEPKKPVVAEDKDAIIAAQREGLLAKERQLDAWKAFGRKYAGTPLEDTGINLAGPAGLLGLLGVIALCIFCPGFVYVVVRIIPVLWGAARRMTVSIESFTRENPEAGSKLKTQYLSRKLHDSHKAFVKARKRAIKPEELVTAPAASA